MAEDHHVHLNKAINYVVENITEPPNLDEVSRVSGFSKFHFHRLFKAFTGETLNQFIKRIRLEQAAFMLLFDKERTITDIALSCGFSNSQNFATAFKKYFSITPNLYKQNQACQGIAIPDPDVVARYDIQLIYLEAIHLIYQRYFGSYYSDAFYGQQTRVSADHPGREQITIYWDDPAISTQEQHRYDHGVVVNKGEYAANATQTIDEGIYIALKLQRSTAQQIDRTEAWSYLYSSWLPRHGYIPNKPFCFEIAESETITLHVPIKKF